MREVVPLSKRPAHIVVLGFFFFNIIFVTYFIDVEQIIITDTSNFEYPVWPPEAAIKLFHWFGTNYDPLLMARPVWFRMTIWIDCIFFGPFYLFAIYAFIRGRDWIRIPTLLYSAVMITNVTIILGEEVMGPHAGPQLATVLFSNASWLLFPIFLIYHMWTNEHPFTRAVEGTSPDTPS